tara:strand:- start:254 stop:964 length:711 start_codon:yes stop_codon:yes gene_type:complete
MLDLTGRVIMISGANRGIGLAVAHRLLDAGAKLSLGMRNIAVITTQFGETQQIILNRYDAHDAGSAQQWVENTVSTFGKIDGLVNNAGISRPAVSLMDDDETELDNMWAVNVKGPTRLTRFAMPYLAESGTGRVVNVASLSGKRVKNDNMGYAMTKFAIVALTHATRRQGWDQGIRATAICPSFVRTDMTSDVSGVDPNDMIQPQDLAELIQTALTLPNNAVVAEMLVNYTLEDMF